MNIRRNKGNASSLAILFPAVNKNRPMTANQMEAKTKVSTEPSLPAKNVKPERIKTRKPEAEEAVAVVFNWGHLV